MKDSFINQCLLLLKRDDIKKNINECIYPIMYPIINILLKEIYPYIYLSLIFIFLSFLLHLGILLLLLKNKSINTNII
jgi:hypothetical protein